MPPKGKGGWGKGGGGLGGTRIVSKAPWSMDPSIEFDPNPSKVFPEYNISQPSTLKAKEEKQVNLFLLFREQLHDGPLYTHARTRKHGADEPARVYGRDQMNSRYGTTNKANVDPFLAVPTYSQRFHRSERALPNLASQPFAKQFFPKELHKTLDGDEGPASKRRKTAKMFTLSKITSLRTAEEVFLGDKSKEDEDGDDEGVGYDKMMDMMTKLEKDTGDGEGEAGFLSGEDDDDWVRDDDDGEMEAEDQYEDEDDNDYNAEQYFDDGAGDDDDDGGDDDIGTY
ncbi:hypothetical protein GQ53DRAFT_775275 [Thozetella sp. PMI_491]|nr:hypothetical protein GQ53DRAFT_775275 [Thozetella sp. PMI_491]